MCATRKNISPEESDDSAKQPAKKRKPRASTKEEKPASAAKKNLKRNAAPKTEDCESQAAFRASEIKIFSGEESANEKCEETYGNGEIAVAVSNGETAVAGGNGDAAKSSSFGEADTQFFPSDGFKRHIARIKAAKERADKIAEDGICLDAPEASVALMWEIVFDRLCKAEDAGISEVGTLAGILQKLFAADSKRKPDKAKSSGDGVVSEDTMRKIEEKLKLL